MASAGVKSDVLLYLILDLVDEFLHLILLQRDTLFFEELEDILAGVGPFFRSEKQTHCGSGDSAADHSAYNMNRFHNTNSF